VAQIDMSLLRIYAQLSEPPKQCRWALINEGQEPMPGEGLLSDIPRKVARVQLVIPATQMMIARVCLPASAKRNPGSMLAYAIEDQIVSEPEATQVWQIGAASARATGSANDAVALCAVEKKSLIPWRDALAAVGFKDFEIQCEIFLMPVSADEWSIAWDGREGFVRTGEFDGTATDCGDIQSPPLSLRMALNEAKACGSLPTLITIFPATSSAAPDLESWQRILGVPLRMAGIFNWQSAPPNAGVEMIGDTSLWHIYAGALADRLRTAALIFFAALALHAVFLATDWLMLANEQRTIRDQMERKFRALYPDAVAVVDPALQLRRKLAEVRHASGKSDEGDFLPMIEKVAASVKELPPGSLRLVSYENNHLTIEVAGLDDADMRRITARLLQAGLRADVPTVAPGQSRTSRITLHPL